MSKGRFEHLDDLIRNIAQSLTDVEHKDLNIAESAKKVCKLLYYMERNPLQQPDSTKIGEPTFDTLTEVRDYILNRRVLLVPRVPEETERGAFIVIIIDDFTLSPNEIFKPNNITFDVLVHHDDWLLNNSLRPFVILQQIDNIFNNKKLAVGHLKFATCDTLVLSPVYIGYRLVYNNVDFN